MALHLIHKVTSIVPVCEVLMPTAEEHVDVAVVGELFGDVLLKLRNERQGWRESCAVKVCEARNHACRRVACVANEAGVASVRLEVVAIPTAIPSAFAASIRVAHGCPWTSTAIA